jgi:hypothetical protein
MVDIQTSEVDSKLAPLNVGPWNFVFSSPEDEQLLIRPFLWKTKNTNMAGNGKLKFKFNFMERTHEPLHLVKWNFVHWKIVDIPTSFIWIIIFFDRALEYGNSLKLWDYVGTNAELLCVESCNSITWAKGSRLKVQFLNATCSAL